MCYSNPFWKREVAPEHKFDFVDVDEFREQSSWRKFQRFLVFVVIIKSILVYVADFWTAYLLLTSNSWGDSINPSVPFTISKWVFVGCIIMSYILLLWEFRKARRIVKSRDIAYAFTNIAAYRVWSIKGYPYFCLFAQISQSTRITDDIAFFIFFRLKTWKTLIIAEGPRQVINAVTLWAMLYEKYDLDVEAALFETQSSMSKQMAFILMTFTLGIFVIYFTMLVLAFLLYIPLLISIRGNLKEYVCHLVDKRVTELLKRNTRKRVLLNQREAILAARKLKTPGATPVITPLLKNGSIEKKLFMQPTLPRFDDIEELKRTPSRADTYAAVNSPLMAPPPPPYPTHQRRTSFESIYSTSTMLTCRGFNPELAPPVPYVAMRSHSPIPQPVAPVFNGSMMMNAAPPPTMPPYGPPPPLPVSPMPTTIGPLPPSRYDENERKRVERWGGNRGEGESCGHGQNGFANTRMW